ncbi:MAG: transcriptional repressor LexA [Planctomycetota bacterium]
MASYTKRQRDVLGLVRDALAESGLAPTLGELGRELGVSRVTVLQHLRALEEKGAIRRTARRSRAIEIVDPAFRPAAGVPIAGTIAAGEPILAVEDRQEVTLDELLGIAGAGGPEGLYLLRVRGHSMVDDHIADGDLVLVEGRRAARRGETVVAMVDGEATLKRFYREKGRVRLQPSNARLRPRYVHPKDLEIRGVVRAVIRRV